MVRYFVISPPPTTRGGGLLLQGQLGEAAAAANKGVRSTEDKPPPRAYFVHLLGTVDRNGALLIESAWAVMCDRSRASKDKGEAEVAACTVVLPTAIWNRAFCAQTGKREKLATPRPGVLEIGPRFVRHMSGTLFSPVSVPRSVFLLLFPEQRDPTRHRYLKDCTMEVRTRPGACPPHCAAPKNRVQGHRASH